MPTFEYFVLDHLYSNNLLEIKRYEYNSFPGHTISPQDSALCNFNVQYFELLAIDL